MKKIALGTAMLLLPAGYVFYLIASKIGVVGTIATFVTVAVWVHVAVELTYKGCKKR